jgi:hypothetical protein
MSEIQKAPFPWTTNDLLYTMLGDGTVLKAPAPWSTNDLLYSLLERSGTARGGGTGDVTAAVPFGTDNCVVRADGTGKGVQASGVLIDDAGNLTVPDQAYDATAWNDNLSVPTKNAIRDKIDSMVTPVTVYLTGAEQTTTSPTAVNVTGMSFSIPANQIWSFEMNLVLSVSAAGASIKFAITIPTGATIGAQVRGSSNAVVITAGGVLTTGTMSSSTGSAIIAGAVQTAGNAGAVQLQFASGDGIATARIGLPGATNPKLGCYLTARKVG